MHLRHKTTNRCKDICQRMRVLYAVPILRDLLTSLSVFGFLRKCTRVDTRPCAIPNFCAYSCSNLDGKYGQNGQDVRIFVVFSEFLYRPAVCCHEPVTAELEVCYRCAECFREPHPHVILLYRGCSKWSCSQTWPPKVGTCESMILSLQ